MWYTLAILMAILPRWIQRTERESSQCSWQCAGQKGQIPNRFSHLKELNSSGTGILLYQRTFFTSSQWWINWFDDPISWGTFCEDNFNKARCDYRLASKDVGSRGQSVVFLWWMDGQVLADEGRKAEGDEALRFAGILWLLLLKSFDPIWWKSSIAAPLNCHTFPNHNELQEWSTQLRDQGASLQNPLL